MEVVSQISVNGNRYTPNIVYKYVTRTLCISNVCRSISDTTACNESVRTIVQCTEIMQTKELDLLFST